MTQGGGRFAWSSPEILGLFGLSVALFGAFIWAERRAADPVLPLSLFKLRIMSVSSAGNFLSGALLFGVTSYVPVYVQGVRGEDAAGAGAVLTPMLLGWAVSAFFSPRFLLRFGYRTTAIGATLLIAIGASVLVLLGPSTPKLLLFFAVTVMGLGFGPSTVAFVMAVQEAVPWNVRGVATSSTQLFRSLGGTLGVALLGAILQIGLRRELAGSGLEGVNSGALLDPSARDGLSPETLVGLQRALGEALGPVFLVTAGLAVVLVTVVVVFARGEEGVLRRRAARPTPIPRPADAADGEMAAATVQERGGWTA